MRWYQYTITPSDPGDGPVTFGGMMKGPDIPDIIECLEANGLVLEGDSVEVKPWGVVEDGTEPLPLPKTRRKNVPLKVEQATE